MDLWRSHPDISSLFESGNIRGLLRLLKHPNPEIQWRAAQALGKLGGEAVSPLIAALENRNTDIRLGAIEALGDIRDRRAIPSLVQRLKAEKSEEVRWAIALTLGEIGDRSATGALVNRLSDPSRYVRYGAALSLQKLGWIPNDARSRARFCIAQQQWDRVREIGEEALVPLVERMSDEDSRIRTRVVETLGELGSPKAEAACDRALIDPSREVRWKALIAFPRCGLPVSHLARGLTRRPKTGYSPVIAAFLNLLFPGIGYNYLGKWYGFLLFQINLAFIVILSLILGPILPYAFSYSFGFLISVHAWNMAKAMPDLP